MFLITLVISGTAPINSRDCQGEEPVIIEGLYIWYRYWDQMYKSFTCVGAYTQTQVHDILDRIPQNMFILLKHLVQASNFRLQNKVRGNHQNTVW